MKSGRVVGDGPAAKVMQDRSLLDSARVAQPQLVEFYRVLSTRPPEPFVDYLEARRWAEASRP